MFSSKKKGGDGHIYDSKEEWQVSRHLDKLTSESVVRSYGPHPLIAGFEVDFWVQAGADSGSNSQVFAVEYDGLGLNRKESLDGRVKRLSELAKYGIETRWLTGCSFESVRNVVVDYHPPHFVWKSVVCAGCGESENVYVIDRNGKHDGKKSITVTKQCEECKRRS